MKRKRNRVIVACRIMQPELEKILKPDDGVEIRYLDQGLHMTPKKMTPLIQEQIDMVTGRFDEIVLGYGLCANGIVGVLARKEGLYVPRSHDCIALFMGSFEAYRAAIKKRPGTFYLTAGWIEGRKDPLSNMEDRYVPRMGREMAEWGMKEELKHYSHFVLINTGVGDMDQMRRKLQENAKFFGKEYEELPGSLSLLKKMINESLRDNDFIFIEPGGSIHQNMFLSIGGKISPDKADLYPDPISLKSPTSPGSAIRKNNQQDLTRES